MATPGRSNTLDAVKVLMAFLVISIHTITPGTEFKYFLTQVIARIAVPFFFISAGYFFSSKNDKNELFKTTIRLSLLYLAWCLFYSPFIITDVYNSSNSFFSAIGNVTYLLLKGWRHMWYMPAMIFAVVLYYYLKDTKLVYFIAIILYAIGILVQNITPQSEYSILYYRNFLTFGFPLIAIGSFLRVAKLSNQSILRLVLALVVTTSMLAVEGLIRYKSAMYNNDMLIFAPSVAAAIFLLSLKSTSNFPAECRSVASSMYFVHFLFYLTLKGFISNEYELFAAVSAASILFSFYLGRLRLYRLIFT
ncbi:acyltransferase family protein [Edaphovirga cremea]|uniref:acyltransferase family protein n=1 Tax=Edaphovirga cremea TaxID=2267246 RepID=UPI000DEFCB1C|nr:acyltransferase family protein [Edaphovirga cremea]